MKNAITSLFYIIFGTFVLALGINLFLLPQKLSTGGVSGIGTILKYLFGIPLSFTNLIINAILFVIGFRLLGKNSIIKTVVGIIALTAFLEITAEIPYIKCDKLSALIAGSVFVGLGIGVIIRQGASSGGSDFLALMLNKKIKHISVAKIIFAVDFIVVLISGFVFKSFEITVYSLTALFISSKIADYILVLGDSAKSVYIFSDKNNHIAKIILQKMERGVTAIKAKGMFYGNDKDVLFCAVTPKELPEIVSVVKQIDQNAFLIINDVHKILGEGFKKHLTI